MTLDGLVAALLFEKLQDVDRAHAAIPVRSTDGLFQASAAIMEPIDQGRAVFIATLRPHKVALPMHVLQV